MADNNNNNHHSFLLHPRNSNQHDSHTSSASVPTHPILNGTPAGFPLRQNSSQNKMSYFRLATSEQSLASECTLNEPLLLDEENHNTIANTNNNDNRHDEETGNSTNRLRSPEQRVQDLRVLIRRKIGNFLESFALGAMLIFVPIVIYRAFTDGRADIAAFDSAGIMVLGTVILSIRIVYLHLTHWYMPDVQKFVVRILFMVPIYAIQSWLSLRFHNARIYIDTIRDLYEAFVIASFLYYLIELLGGQDALVSTLERKALNPNSAHVGKHQFPLSLVLQPWELGLEFMLQCKHGVLQYVVFKTIATLLTCFFEVIGMYGEGKFEWFYAYPYISFFLNISVMYALYCLVMLFHAVNKELCEPVNWRPLGKFLCVKGVVFFTWWQGVVIFFLRSKGIIKDVGSWTNDEVSNGLIDYCICVEMVFFAIAHSYTFSYKEYLPSTHVSSTYICDGRSDTTNINNNTEQTANQNDSHDYDNNNTNDSLTSNSNITNSNSSNNVAHAAAVAASSGDDIDSTTSSVTGTGNSNNNNTGPQPLTKPMNFKDAFWSSTQPKEMFDDINRFRNGVKPVKEKSISPGAISLQEVVKKDNHNGDNNASNGNNNDNNNI